jgi:POT family proton-dependent oligopeptide transporter
MSTPSTVRNDRWPPQIKYIVGNEACERFSYYGMKGILAGYMTGAILKGGLNMSDDRATSIFHLFVFANYFTPLIGAWLSDKLFGRYGTILWVSLFYCAGHGVLAMNDLFTSVDAKFNLLCVGLTLIAFGAGGIKPCVSAFMGDQFKPDQGHLMQKAYGAFYFSINFGSFFSFIVIPRLREVYGYGWAFGVPGILMGIATIIFWLGRKKYVRVPPTRVSKRAGFFAVVWYALTHGSERKAGQGFWDVARNKYSDGEVNAAQSVGPILGVFALIPAFWALFDQSNSTWVLQGNKMVPLALTGFWKDAFGWFFGDAINAENMQSTNPLLVMILVPFLTLGVYQWFGRYVTPLRRMGCGMFIAAFSYVIVAWLQQRIEAGEQISVAWQALPYVFLTTGEVLISATGLEFAFTQAAPEMKSTIMSFWLLTVAAGNALVSVITSVLSTEAGGHSGAVSSGRFMLYAGMTAVVGVLFILIAMRYRYRDTAPPAQVAAS